MSVLKKNFPIAPAMTRILVLSLVMCLVMGLQSSKASDDSYLKKFLACDNFSNPANRAACFEAALQEYYADHPNASEQADDNRPNITGWAQQLPSPSTSDSPAARQQDTINIARSPAQRDDGADDSHGDEPELIIAKIEKFSRNPLGRAIIELDNGQTWSQIDGRRIAFSSGDTIEISRNFVGGYKLAIPERGTFVRVRRVQ